MLLLAISNVTLVPSLIAIPATKEGFLVAYIIHTDYFKPYVRYKEQNESKHYFYHCQFIKRKYRQRSMFHWCHEVHLGGTNRYFLAKTIEMLRDALRGGWMLVKAFNVHHLYYHMRNQHVSQQRHFWTPMLKLPLYHPFIVQQKTFSLTLNNISIIFDVAWISLMHVRGVLKNMYIEQNLWAKGFFLYVGYHQWHK